MDYTPNDPAAAAPPPYTPPTPLPPPTVSGLPQNTAAALAYVTFIPALIFLLTPPYNQNPYIRFHSVQSIALFVVWVAWSFAHLLILWIPILGLLISILVGLAFFATWVFTVYKASQGEWFKLPFLGDFAMGQAKA